MLLGIDYGTTRTVVAAVDRGNYPVVSPHRRWRHPGLVSLPDHHAWRRTPVRTGGRAPPGRPGLGVAPLLQAALGDAGARDADETGYRCRHRPGAARGILAQLRRDLVTRSNLHLTPQEPLEAVIAVPANANSNQRFLTLEAFRRAGFQVRGLLNEPSAAGIEYAHHARRAGPSARRELVVVYDLGGGTFDASVISLAARRHEVLRSAGIAQLGGDDVDTLLLDLALAQAGVQDWMASPRYLAAADKYPRPTRRQSQGQKGMDERALMASQSPSHPW